MYRATASYGEVIKAMNGELDACSRRNNVHIVGVPESTAMGCIETYMEEMLHTLFGKHLTTVFAVEQVHRSLGPHPRRAPGVSARLISARLLHYCNRDFWGIFFNGLDLLKWEGGLGVCIHMGCAVLR